MASLVSLADLPKLGDVPPPANTLIEPEDETTTSIDLANHLDALLADHEVRDSRLGIPNMIRSEAEEKDCLDLAVDKMNDILQVKYVEPEDQETAAALAEALLLKSDRALAEAAAVQDAEKLDSLPVFPSSGAHLTDATNSTERKVNSKSSKADAPRGSTNRRSRTDLRATPMTTASNGSYSSSGAGAAALLGAAVCSIVFVFVFFLALRSLSPLLHPLSLRAWIA